MEGFDQLWQSMRDYLPSLLAALAILVVGWIAARIIAALVRAGLKRTTIDNKLAVWLAGEERGKSIAVENVAAKIVFYTILVFVLIAFFQTIGLTQLAQPLNVLLNEVFAFAPRLFGAAALAAVAWLVATALRMVVTRVLARTKLDERVGQEAGREGVAPIPLSKTLGDAVYWLVFLLFLPAILGALALEGLLEPVQVMMNKVLEYLPNVASAAAILLVGWFVARIIQRVVGSLLAAVGLDRLSESTGISRALGSQSLSQLLALVVYVLILIPVLVSALNALGLEAVTRPASNMLDTLLSAVPRLFAAGLVLAIAYMIGRIVSDLLSSLLRGAGFDNLLGRLGLKTAELEENRRPSSVAGYLAMAAIMFFAAIEAFTLMGLGTLAGLGAELLVFGGHVLVGLVIFGAGLYLANLAGSTIQAGGASQARLLAAGARVAILVLAGAMALRQLGVADEIITLAFGLSLGAIAVAAAVAFGLGGRDLAARQLDEWHSDMRGGDR
jgi:hypothetical protein